MMYIIIYIAIGFGFWLLEYQLDFVKKDDHLGKFFHAFFLWPWYFLILIIEFNQRKGDDGD